MRKTLLLISVIMVGVVPLSAQEPGRTLNGYSFIPSALIQDPFAISYFHSGTGGGVAFDLKTPQVDLDGDTIGVLTGDVAFLALDFEYQQRFGSWFAARIGFGGSGRVGVDEQSVLAEGVTGILRWNFGATARLMQRRSVAVSVAVDFGRSDIVGLDPFGFAKTVVDEGLDADNSLVSTADVESARLSGRIAWAPARWIGITGLIEGGSADITDSSSEAIFGGGGSVGLDFGGLSSVPIGVLLSVITDAFNQNGSDLSSRSTGFGFGAFYTGWEDFNIGLEGTLRQFERRRDESNFEAFFATFNLRYWP